MTRIFTHIVFLFFRLNMFLHQIPFLALNGPQTSPPFPCKSIRLCRWTEGKCSSCWIMQLNNETTSKRGASRYILHRTRTMQSLRYTESRPEPGLRDRGQQHLPGNLSCSDYTMCLASLWAILPFCSVKYKRHSGKGKGLEKVGGLAYQFTTFEFTEPGTGILL